MSIEKRCDRGNFLHRLRRSVRFVVLEGPRIVTALFHLGARHGRPGCGILGRDAIRPPRTHAAAFYRDALGFRLVADQGPFQWVARDRIEILLREGSPDPGAMELVLYSDALERDVARLQEAGVTIELRGSCHHFRDPDGHAWQLVDPTADHSD